MRAGCIKLGILVVVLSLTIYILKNKEDIINLLKTKIKRPKVLVQIIYIVLIICILCCMVLLIKTCINFSKKENISLQWNERFKEVDEKISKESKIYNELINKEYENDKWKNPYIPYGFSYVEGYIENGYVIQDSLKNQYVWIPCTNKNIDNIVKLKKRNRNTFPFIDYKECYNEKYEEFLKSSLENGGFYISRYEVGKEEDKPVSKANVEVWTNITRNEAINIADAMYYDINCELINSYAYDTTLEWIEKTSIVKLEGKEIEIKKDEKIFSGRNVNNNIYDFCDNILEYTLENSYDTIIERGFFNSNTTESTRAMFSNESRYSVQPTDINLSEEMPIVMRTVLYK